MDGDGASVLVDGRRDVKPVKDRGDMYEQRGQREVSSRTDPRSIHVSSEGHTFNKTWARIGRLTFAQNRRRTEWDPGQTGRASRLEESVPDERRRGPRILQGSACKAYTGEYISTKYRLSAGH